MKLHTGALFWPTTCNPVRKPHYDAVIIGGGISGILTAKVLLDEGLQIALLERDAIGSGSTAANSGLLQYTNDIQLHELIEQIGERDAVRFYTLCVEAINTLEEIAASLLGRADFIRRPSICLASKKRDAQKLKLECETLVKHGFPAHYWNDVMLAERLQLAASAALYTEQDAELNPYKFVVTLAESLKRQGLHIFEKTIATRSEGEEGQVTIQTMEGPFNTKKSFTQQVMIAYRMAH